jgi:chromosome partitioning protein
MVITVGNIKGGVGKTTVALNLTISQAVGGRKVLLVDADAQQTAADFTRLRTELLGDPGYAVISLSGTNVRTSVQRMAPDHDLVVIDVGGRNTESLRAALVASDRLIIPVQPRMFDMWTVHQMQSLLKEVQSFHADIEALLLLNAADAQGQDNADTVAYIQEHVSGMQLLQARLGRRKAYHQAQTQGRSVLEIPRRDAKVQAEFRAVLAELGLQSAGEGV